MDKSFVLGAAVIAGIVLVVGQHAVLGAFTLLVCAVAAVDWYR